MTRDEAIKKTKMDTGDIECRCENKAIDNGNTG